METNQIDPLIKNYGTEKAIKLLEERIQYSYNHPNNPFFFSVRKDAEIRLKTIKQI